MIKQSIQKYCFMIFYFKEVDLTGARSLHSIIVLRSSFPDSRVSEQPANEEQQNVIPWKILNCGPRQLMV